ncbi:MAG: NosD domain-containing protein [Planctomycetota bacterium]
MNVSSRCVVGLLSVLLFISASTIVVLVERQDTADRPTTTASDKTGANEPSQVYRVVRVQDTEPTEGERATQPIEELVVTPERPATLEVMTDHGRFEYHIDNTGQQEVSAALQEVFDRVAALKDTSATFEFLPGVYYIDAPLSIRLVSVELRGSGHRGIDVHGMNLKSGAVFRFGKNTGPNCITFLAAGHSKSFPSGESPWNNRNYKIGVRGMTFVGYNNTGVDTASGYSRFRGDEPNFRGLHWYPAPDRYNDIDKEGQRALVLTDGGGKCEMLAITDCVFTELYVGIETGSVDVCNITDSWFAQMAYGIRMRGHQPVLSIENNCFADIETGVIVSGARMANLNSNGFAYVSKCFELYNITYSTLNHNTVDNWERSTGAAAHGGFCHIKGSKDLVMVGNSVRINIDARAKTVAVDEEPNGRAFVNIENATNLMMANNVFDTIQTQTVVRLHNVSHSAILDNLIHFGKGGNAVAQTGNSTGNTYRPLNPAQSASFDQWVE